MSRLKYTITAGAEISSSAQGRFLFVKDAAGPLAVIVETLDGKTSDYPLEKNDQIDFPARIRQITIANTHNASQVIEILTGEGKFIPNQDGLEVVLTGQDIALEVSTPPGAPLEIESTDAKPVKVVNKAGDVLDVAGPLTDAELRATAVPVSGPMTLAELDATIVNTIASAATAGGTERHRLLTAATTNGTSIKATPGQVYSVNGTNTSAGTLYLKFYDKASAPTVGTDTPLETYALPPGPFSFVFPLGSEFSTGIALAVTGGIADADTTPTVANDVVMQTHFA